VDLPELLGPTTTLIAARLSTAPERIPLRLSIVSDSITTASSGEAIEHVRIRRLLRLWEQFASPWLRFYAALACGRPRNRPIGYVRPERDPEKLFCFLYPSELLALLRGSDADGKTVVPLGRRVLYAIATFTGQRKGSLYALRWKHVDFAHGTLASFKTKTGRAQYFVADRGLVEVLAAWHVHKGKPDDEQPLVSDVDVDYDRKRLATALRDDLKAVGVSRALLYEEDAPNVEPLRFHDLRSTFCTWARRAGKSDAWISERTGHELSGDMISRYDRGATTLEDLAYAPFPDIADALPELAEAARLATRLATTGNGGSGATGESVMISDASLVGARGFARAPFSGGVLRGFSKTSGNSQIRARRRNAKERRVTVREATGRQRKRVPQAAQTNRAAPRGTRRVHPRAHVQITATPSATRCRS